MNHKSLFAVVILVILISIVVHYTGSLLPITWNGLTGSKTQITIKNPKILQNLHPPFIDLGSETHDINITMEVDNTGQVSTSTLQVEYVCSPDFAYCENTASAPETFILPPGQKFVENTIISCYTNSHLPPCSGTPVTNQNYFLKLRFTFQDGSSSVLNVAATATGFFPLVVPFAGSIANPVTVTVTKVESEVSIRGINGKMSTVVSVDQFNLPMTAELLDVSNHELVAVAYEGGSASNTAGNKFCCGVNLTTSFSTVTTGISPGTYYIERVIIGSGPDTVGHYDLWTQALEASQSSSQSSTSTQGSNSTEGLIVSQVHLVASNFAPNYNGNTFVCVSSINDSSSYIKLTNNLQNATSVLSVDLSIPSSNSNVVMMGDPFLPSGQCSLPPSKTIFILFPPNSHSRINRTAGESFQGFIVMADREVIHFSGNFY